VIQGLDHVVFVTLDLDSTVAGYKNRGFIVTPGGEHPGGVSYNALIGFEDGSYLEIFAFHDLEKAKAANHSWAPVAERGGGWADFALRSNDLDADVAALGPLVARPPEDGGRTRPDGMRIGWKVARLEKPLPFLIQDTTARENRVPQGAATRHRDGTKRVERIVIGATDPAGVRKKYEALAARGAPPVEFMKSGRDALNLVLLG
jgi:hypothetical protein